MMDELKQLMAKKQTGEKMSPEEVKAKMDVIVELLEMAQEAMGSQVKGGMDEMKQVSVMAPDSESLSEGLDVAKEVAEDMPELEAKEEVMGMDLDGDDEADEPADHVAEVLGEDDEEDEFPNIFAQRREKMKKRV